MSKGLTKQEQAIAAQFFEWSTKMGLRGWDLQVYFPKKWPHNPEWWMCCEPDWEYQQALIKVNSKLCRNVTEVRLEELIVHELAHCLLAPLKGRRDIVEMVTTMVTRSITGRYQ